MAASRYCRPVYFASVDQTEGQLLEEFRIESNTEFSEAWLQERLFRHPEALPMREIDPGFGPAAKLCQELPTRDGYVDLAYISETGRLMLVECKLWKNPESRREVIGQILEYAKDIASWDYDRLSETVGRVSKRTGKSLYEIASEQLPDLDEAIFVDNVNRSLRQGDFLLVIAGDGIRENIEQMVSFLQTHAGLRFSLALVEVAIYRMRTAEFNGLLMQPRVLARTVEIERTTYRGMDTIDVAESKSTPASGKIRLTLDGICESLSSISSNLGPDMRKFIKRLESLDIRPIVMRSIVLRYADEDLGKLNFGTISPEGKLTLNYICDSAEQAGDLSIGEDYLHGIARFVPQWVVLKNGLPWTWTVRANQEGDWLSVEDALRHSDEWFELVSRTLNRFIERKRIMQDRDDS